MRTQTFCLHLQISINIHTIAFAQSMKITQNYRIHGKPHRTQIPKCATPHSKYIWWIQSERTCKNPILLAWLKGIGLKEQNQKEIYAKVSHTLHLDGWMRFSFREMGIFNITWLFRHLFCSVASFSCRATEMKANHMKETLPLLPHHVKVIVLCILVSIF